MNMKTILAVLLLTAAQTTAQSVSVRAITNDGSIQATNAVNLPSTMVQGLLSLWADDSRSKTNAGAAALTFNQFVTQELGDKSADWNRRGGLDAAKTFAITQGQTNLSIPNIVGDRWSGFTQAQRTNVISFLSSIGNPF
jgi:hypothetical protein